ncbi:MAG TPA: IclR family transcriptional regulator [Candidimonas sp.]|nr:IclR family transcriptional regulator [Candidimonas sp.]
MDKTFLKGLVLLEAMAKNEKSSGVTELAAQLSLNKSNVHRLLQGLVHQGFARKVPESSRYELTTKLWELGARVFNRLDVRLETLPYMKLLAEETQETVHLSILDGTEVLYIEKIDSPQPVRAYTTVGGRAPASCVATGKVLLAWAGNDVIALALQQLRPFTTKTIVDPAEFHEQFDQIRSVGYAINSGEWREQVVGVAAPLRDVTGAVVAAIGISGPAERLTPEQLRAFAPRLIELATLASKRLGYTGR